jgi:DNA invertase Pin-like site-specific DNA recombinase
MPKAFSYIRFSSPEQAKGDSQRRQLEIARRYAKAHGLELASSAEYSFLDAGKSAYKGRHLDDEGQLKRFLELVESGDIPTGSYLLVESLDRLSREKVQIALPRFLDLLNKGINVVTLTDEKCYSAGADYTDLIVSIIYMARAHEESATKGIRVSAAWKEKQKDARAFKTPLGKACPQWLRLEDGAYQPIPERVNTVHMIFNLSLAGKGAGLICKQLNAQNNPPFGSKNRNKAGLWSVSSVKKILNNRALLGEYQPTTLLNGQRVKDGETIEAYYPAVVEESLFYQAQGVAEQRRVSKTTKSAANFNIWQGIAKCSLCGDAMHLINKGKPPKGYTYLQCYGSRIGACEMKMIRLDRAESVYPEILAKVDSLSLVQAGNGRLTKELYEVDGQLKVTKEAYRYAQELFNEYPSKAVAKQLHKYEEERERLETTKTKLTRELATNKVVDKEDFKSRVDLVSYEGRYAANLLIKRLSLYVFFQVLAPDRFYCRISPNPLLGTGVATDEDFFFDIGYNKGQIAVIGHTVAIIDLQLKQGELTDQEWWDNLQDVRANFLD